MSSKILEVPARSRFLNQASRISRGLYNVQISWFDGQPRVLTPGIEYPDFRKSGLESPQPLPVDTNFHRPVGPYSKNLRANQWKYFDYDSDGDHDLIVGIGDWSDYGWDDAYNDAGEWTHGPLHGFVYLLSNEGSDQAPAYVNAVQVKAAGTAIDVFGWPSPNFADFDGDGDLDLLCGEFLDQFTYFQNTGTRQAARYAAGKRVTHNGHPLHMDLQMILPVALDWDRDGDVDLVVGDEDGRVALIEHTGAVDDGIPVFEAPVYFQQEADWVKCGALATPCGVDWDGDGDDDILSGNTAGYIEWFENLGSRSRMQGCLVGPRRSDSPRTDKSFAFKPGRNGSIQGPCEAKWGYTTLTADDWDGDGLPDLMINSIWGKVQWYRNVGIRSRPRLAAARDVEVDWPDGPPRPEWNWWTPSGKQLVTQWRTTPVMIDWNGDGLKDLVILDHEGYLTLLTRRADWHRPAAPRP